ncbi:hypothetical protein [Rhodovulum sp. FJ3]|uniref:hypothetical protein n=1 Tax=Rhodovulum sp. FJ3 TaxID=3079053 RepID=UPI00293DC9C8|nr:hypothetical protein [Rhodovulum sp. FJ3]MDV4167779.1 hypothetical protein [Rhodovulum sp. FJ3]
MTDELKPCPTCGQRPYTYIGKDGKSVLARDLEDEHDRLREALENVLGHVNTPIGRRRLNISDPHPEWLVEARNALEASK